MAQGSFRSSKVCENIFGNVKCILIDLSGTLHIGDNAVDGAVLALQRLRKTGLKIRFVTNSTKESKRCLLERLSKIGFDVKLEEIFTSLVAARKFVEKRSLNPFLILDKMAIEDFEGVNCENPNAVVVGLAKTDLNYDKLNLAFRLLKAGAEFIAVHKGRYYRDGTELSLGPGPFVKGLEFSTGKEALVVGKPAPAFFSSALESVGCEMSEAVMIGDDVRDDVAGAMQLGIKGVLVKTGKYQNNDEESIFPAPDLVCDSFSSAVANIIASLSKPIKESSQLPAT